MPRQRDPRGRFVKGATPADMASPVDMEGAEPSDSFLSELQASWSRHGAATIEKVRLDRPHDYLRLMASSLSKRAEGEGGGIDSLSDDEIADELRHILGELAAAGVAPGP